jgi:hypothetical protein
VCCEFDAFFALRHGAGMSARQIIEELPRLTAAELREVEQRIKQIARAGEAADLLQQWIDEPQEGTAVDDAVLRAMDDGRAEQRPHFPPELKGVTW